MTVFAPAHVLSSAPAVSLAALIEPRVPASAETIPFKNVLDAFETANVENVLEVQHAPSQGAMSKKSAPDQTPGLQRATPEQDLRIPFPTPHLAKLPAELAGPAQEVA